MGQTVAELRGGLAIEGLTGALGEHVAIAVVPADATVELEFVGLLVVDVHTRHLIGGEALTTTSETTAATTTGEAHIVGVIGVGHEVDLQIVHHHTTEDTACITLLSTGGEVGIGHDTLVHAGLDAEVEHRLFFTVLDT